MTVPAHRSLLDFTHDQLPGRIVFGAGRRHDIPAELARLGSTRVVVIGGSHDEATIDELQQHLDIPTESILGVRPHVPSDTVQTALEVVDRFGPDAVVTVGGGSAIGLGKMIALERDVDLVAVPTTYAGSEMTPIWGTTSDGIKRTGRSQRVLPSTVIYDPELTLSLPRSVTINSAFNALAHCVEALWLPATSPITLETSISAIGTIIEATEATAVQPGSIEARSQLLYGAHRAGSVLAAAGTGLLHQTAHVLGGLFDLEHGAMYAVLTPHMVSHHLLKIPESRPHLVEALGPEPARELHDLARRLDAPSSLAEIGLPPDQSDMAIEAVADRTSVSPAMIAGLLSSAMQPTRQGETP